MNYFFYKLTPPRSTFSLDMTEDEAAVMGEHVSYWTARMQEGLVVLFGPVADPNGSFGIGIIRLAEGSDPQELCENDPAIKANIGFTAEVHSMPRIVVSG